MGTRDEGEADRRVEQLNRLLSDQTYWTPTARARAEREVDFEIAKAFYDGLEIEPVDGWKSRDAVIELPDKREGYTRVLMLGSTGAGKTTFVRQLIGSDPARDRFPSTATAKTTTAAIEIVMDDGPYRAVVSFSPQELVRGCIEECVITAVSSAVDDGTDEQVMEALMEDREQRFRMTYILGRWEPPANDEPRDDDVWGDWDSGDGIDEADDEPDSGPMVKPDEHVAHAQHLQDYLNRVRSIAVRVRASVEDEVGSLSGDERGEDREAFLELLEEHLCIDVELQLLVDDILDDIAERFDALGEEAIDRGRDGWPVRWQFENGDRSTFLREVKQVHE